MLMFRCLISDWFTLKLERALNRSLNVTVIDKHAEKINCWLRRRARGGNNNRVKQRIRTKRKRVKIEIRGCQRSNKSACVRFDVPRRATYRLLVVTRVSPSEKGKKNPNACNWYRMKGIKNTRGGKSGLVFRYYCSIETTLAEQRYAKHCSVQLALYSWRIMRANGWIKGSGERSPRFVHRVSNVENPFEPCFYLVTNRYWRIKDSFENIWKC